MFILEQMTHIIVQHCIASCETKTECSKMFFFLSFYQLHTAMRLQEARLAHWQMKNRHHSITAAVGKALTTIRAMKCTKKSHCLQDWSITLTKNLKVHTTYWIQRQGTSRSITRYICQMGK